MTAPAPLLGRRVVLTASSEKGGDLPRRFEAAGATVVEVPLIETERLADHVAVRAALDRVRGGAGAAWVVFGSATAVHLVAESAGPHFPGLTIAAVGPATAAALRRLGAVVTLMPSVSSSDALVAELAAAVGENAQVLVLVAEGSRLRVAPPLVATGAHVETLLLYRSVMPQGGGARFAAALSGSPDAVVFTSSSTIRHAGVALQGADPPGCVAACIGEPTASAARAAGWNDVVIARRATAEALVEAVVGRLGAAEPLP